MNSCVRIFQFRARTTAPATGSLCHRGCRNGGPDVGLLHGAAQQIVEGRRKRRKRQPNAAFDQTHLLQHPLCRDRVGLDEEVAMQSEQLVVV